VRLLRSEDFKSNFFGGRREAKFSNELIFPDHSHWGMMPPVREGIIFSVRDRQFQTAVHFIPVRVHFLSFRPDCTLSGIKVFHGFSVYRLRDDIRPVLFFEGNFAMVILGSDLFVTPIKFFANVLRNL